MVLLNFNALKNNSVIDITKGNYLCGVVKKILVAILAFLYLGVSSGIAMEIHYCMGSKAGVEFYGGHSEKCGKCGMKESKAGCCNDEHKFYKLEDLHKKASNEVSFDAPVVIISNNRPVFEFLLTEQAADAKINNHSPPPLDNTPSICIINCVFRI